MKSLFRKLFVTVLCLSLILTFSTNASQIVVTTETGTNRSTVQNNPFYSAYDNGDLYRSSDGISRLMERANCYGYAFRLAYGDAFIPDSEEEAWGGMPGDFYKQQPGEFADKSEGLNILLTSSSLYDTLYNYLDLMYAYTDYFGPYTDKTDTERLNFLHQVLAADAEALGYTLTKYNGTAIQSASAYTDRRLIAVVVHQSGNSYGDYHFYMQHSDDTWSHKRGTWAPQDACITHGTELTNANITSHICEDIYAGGAYQFYYITKNAVTDYTHQYGNYPGTVQTLPTSGGDLAGNHLPSAKYLGIAPVSFTNARFDSVDDVDCYRFMARVSANRTVTVSTTGSVPVVVEVYNYTGTLVSSNSVASGICILQPGCTAGLNYYLRIYSPNQIAHIPNNTYSVYIS